MSLLGWALIQPDPYPYRKRRLGPTERHQGCMCPGRGPQEEAARGSHVQTKCRGLRGKPTLPALSSWTFSLQSCEKIGFCCLGHPVCDVLSRQPQKTNTVRKGPHHMVWMRCPRRFSAAAHALCHCCFVVISVLTPDSHYKKQTFEFFPRTRWFLIYYLT